MWHATARTLGSGTRSMLMRLVLAIVIMICALAMPASARAQQQQAAAPVGTVKAERSQVAQTLDFVGRVESINKVEVKARSRVTSMR
jgi:membrane fusion protein, multidrug efflux system